MNIHKKGFTIIELIVVIAIIAVLASIVTSNVTKYITKAKTNRAELDVNNIEKALIMFNAQYGDYPWGYFGESWWTEFFPVESGGEGDPFLLVNGQQKFLSELYSDNWNNNNAEYFGNNFYYYTSLWDADGDGKIGCGYIGLRDENGDYYGYRYIICQDCDYCNDNYDVPFQTQIVY